MQSKRQDCAVRNAPDVGFWLLYGMMKDSACGRHLHPDRAARTNHAPAFSAAQHAAAGWRACRRQPNNCCGETGDAVKRSDRSATRYALGNNRRLVLCAPRPPAPGARKHLDPAHRLRDSTMLSVRSKPNGQKEDSSLRLSRPGGDALARR